MAEHTLSKTLVPLVERGAANGLSTDEQRQFEAVLDKVLALPASEEEEVVLQVLETISEDPAVGDFFLSELEIQSELVYFGKKKDQAVMLICMPIIFMAGDDPRRLALSTDEVSDLARSLTETDVISAQAKVALLPRLFTATELVTQPYGSLQRLTRVLGEQLLAGDPVRGEAGILLEGGIASEKFAFGDNGYVDLRYVVGVVSIHRSALNDVFPAVGPESTDAELYRLQAQVQADEQDDEGDSGDAQGFSDFETVTANGGIAAEEGSEQPGSERKAEASDAQESDEAGTDHEVEGEDLVPSPFGDLPAAGTTEDGGFWEDIFLDELDATFMSLFGAQATLLPDDFHANLRRGLSLTRESGLKHQIREGFHDAEPVLISAKSFVDETTGRMGWDLYLCGEDGTVRDQAPWEVLQHEAPEDSLENLELLCENCSWTLAEVTPLESEH